MDVLLWMDLETTGFDPRGHLLQVAAIATDSRGEELAEPFERVVYYPDVDTIRSHCDDIVREMHSTTGLWERLPSGVPLAQVEQDTLDYVLAVAPDKQQARMAGSSLRLDLNWAEVHLPRVYQHLHYRSVDVSAIRFALEAFGVTVPEHKVGTAHNAVDDIRGSLNLYRALMGQL